MPPLSPAPGADDAVVVDSLLLREPEPLRALRDAHPSPPFVLLAHYLRCIDPRRQSSPEAAAERAVLPLFDGAVTTSRFAKHALADEGLPADRIGVVPPGLDASYRTAVKERDASDPPELLTVANLLPGKGLLSLVDRLAELDDLAWRGTLVGDDTLDPDFAATLRSRIRSSPIGDRVTCTGALSPDALRDRYDRADVLVLPSRFETCSMAAREAMARGLPVVGYAVGGMPENFGDAAAGRLVPPDAPEALASAVRALLLDPDARAERGAAARARSESFPTWREAAARFHSVLEALRAPPPEGST